MTASPSVSLVEEPDVDPPLFAEQAGKNKRRTKVVRRVLDELSDADRAVIALDAENAVLNGFAS